MPVCVACVVWVRGNDQVGMTEGSWVFEGMIEGLG
jgi:hypothetical protein